MADEIKTDANQETSENKDIQEKPSLIKDAGNKETTLLSQAGKEEQQAQQAEEKRLLEAKDEDLSAEDKTKKDTLIKTKEEEKLINAKDEDLSETNRAKKAELIKAKEAEAKAKQVPEKYEFKMPEGMTLDQEFADKISPVLKELNLTQENAQKLVDIYAEQMQANADAQAANFKQFLKDSYEETVKALGPNYKEELKYVAKIRDFAFSKESQEMFDASGLSNNKSFIIDLIKLGKAISEDTLVSGEKKTPDGEKPLYDRLYGNKDKK
jgi:hypothetical protein